VQMEEQKKHQEQEYVNTEDSSLNFAQSTLTSRGASLKVKGKVYRACIQSDLGYASETWAMAVEDMA